LIMLILRGLGIENWGLRTITNPQSTIPNIKYIKY